MLAYILIAAVAICIFNFAINKHTPIEDTDEFLQAMEPDENSYS
jgi:hypothetical protein